MNKKVLIWGAMPNENDGGAIVNYYQLQMMNQIDPEWEIHVAPKVWEQATPDLMPYLKWHQIRTRYFGQIPNEIPRIMKKYNIPYLVLWHIPWEYFPIIDKVHKIGGKVINWQTIHWSNDVLFLSDKLQDFDWWIPPTNYALETLVGVGGLSRGRMTEIPHGVDLEYFYPHDTRKLREDLGIKQDQKMVLFVGRCQLTKGIVPMMLTARKLCNNFNCHVVFKAGVHEGVTKAKEIAHLLHKMTKWDFRIHFLSQWTTPSFMEELTAASDILVCPSGHEGFSLPPLEAMACFPYNTQVYSSKIDTLFKRYYSGKLIEIELEDGTFLSLTPEHPVLTDFGWSEAKYLYSGMGIYQIGKVNGEELETRRIGDIVEGIRSKLDGVIEKNTEKQRSNSSQNERDEIKKENKRICDDTRSKINEGRTCLYCGNNRRRRNNLISKSKKEKWKRIFSSNNPYLQYETRINDVVGQEINLPSLHWSSTTKERESIRICLSNKRIGNVGILDNVRTLFSNQKTPLSTVNRIYPRKIEQILGRTIFNRRDGNGNRNPIIERKEIKNKTIKSYSGYVYNLGTFGNIYFANNILVHNCQRPVCVTDIPVHRELLGGKNGVCGLLMPPMMKTEYVNDTQMVTVPTSDMIYGSVKYLLENPDEAKVMGEKGLARVKEYYDLKKICLKWFGLLEKLTNE